MADSPEGPTVHRPRLSMPEILAMIANQVDQHSRRSLFLADYAFYRAVRRSAMDTLTSPLPLWHVLQGPIRRDSWEDRTEPLKAIRVIPVTVPFIYV